MPNYVEVLRRVYSIVTRELAEPPHEAKTGVLIEIATLIEKSGAIEGV